MQGNKYNINYTKLNKFKKRLISFTDNEVCSKPDVIFKETLKNLSKVFAGTLKYILDTRDLKKIFKVDSLFYKLLTNPEEILDSSTGDAEKREFKEFVKKPNKDLIRALDKNKFRELINSLKLQEKKIS